MAFNYKTPKIPSLPRLGGGGGSRSRRDLEEEERRRRMMGGAGGLGGLGPAGGARPPMQKRPQKSAMFQKAGGLPSMPRSMFARSLDDEWREGEGSGEGGGTVLDDEWREGEGSGETTIDLPDEPEVYDETGGIEEEDFDTGGYEEDPGVPDIGGGDDWVGDTLLESPDPSGYLSADEPSELDALFEDIIEGLESDIPAVRQNATDQMNAALRRTGEINADLGRSVGGGFGGTMASTTARGLEGIARAEGDARGKIRQAQLGWLDRRLRQQGLDESEERDMKLAFLDMIKDIDPDTLEETYGERDPMKIIEQLFGGGDGGSGLSGDGGDVASDTPLYESASEPMYGDTTTEDDYRYDEASQMYSIDGLERDGNPVQLRTNQVGQGLDNLIDTLDDMSLPAFSGVDINFNALRSALQNPNNELGRQLVTYFLHYYAENGIMPTGEDTYSYLEQVGLDSDFRELALANDYDD